VAFPELQKQNTIKVINKESFALTLDTGGLIIMVKHNIWHKRNECISCGACAAICPDFWEMDEEGLAHLKGSTQDGEIWNREITTEEDRAKNQEAAECCPVNIIGLVEKKEEKKK